jgi:hypothetical protein
VSTHSRLSPSSAVRWMACPGSKREEAKYPEERSSESAIDGTHSHTLLEHCIQYGIDPVMTVGQEFKDHEGTFVVDANRAGRVRIATEYVKSRMEILGHMCLVWSEQQVNPEHLVGRPDLAGTCDIQIHGGGVLEIIDYKDGMNPVPAEDNPQLELYALGVLAGFDLPVNGDYPFKTIRMTIIQPKLVLKNMEPVTSCEVSLETMMAKIGKFAAAAKNTDDPEAPLVPGDAQCRYCRAKGSCAALAQQSMASMGLVFPNVETPVMPAEIAQQAAGKDVNEMTDEQIRQVLEAAPLVRQMIEAAEAEAQKRLEAGRSMPGLKLVHGRGSRSWSLPDDEMAERLTKMGIPKGSVYVTKVVSPAQVSKLQWEKRDGTKKTLTERQLKIIETEYITKSNGKLTVALESDSRPAVTTNAALMFGAVETPAVVELPDWMK